MHAYNFMAWRFNQLLTFRCDDSECTGMTVVGGRLSALTMQCTSRLLDALTVVPVILVL